MSLGKGGSSQNQNQNSTTNASGTQSGTSDTTQTAIPTDLWGNLSTMFGGQLGPSGLNAGQQGALGWAQGQQANNPLDNTVGYAGNVLSRYVDNNHPAYQAAPTSGVSASTVAAPTAASQMGAYQNPYQQQVIDATTAQLSHQNDVGQNALRAQYGGQGWSPTAGSPSGEQVAAGTAQGDYMRTLASTVGGLNQQGFNTAAQLGAGDASNQLNASGQNAQNSLTASNANAGYTQQMNLANLAAKQQNDAQSIGVIQDWVNNAFNQNGADQSANSNIFNMSGGGLSNILAGMTSQVPAFGQNQTGSTTGNYTGTSNTVGTGNSKGKSGGISL